MSPLSTLNHLTPAELETEFTRCCGSGRWVLGMLQHWPYHSLTEMYAIASQLWWDLTPADWREAFSHHPKIGDVASLRQKFATTADLSAAEQSGVNPADEAVLHQLAEANQAYFAKFGYIFIVCATGKTAAQMLAILQSRLPNDPAAEIYVAAEEQRQITFLRLAKWLGEPAPVQRHIAMIILHRPDGSIACQLRDDKPHIASPNMWGMFGGGIEPGENPAEGMLREVEEELTVQIRPEKLRFWRTAYIQREGQARQYVLYSYEVTHELDQAVLQEGQRWAWLTPEQYLSGSHEGHETAPHVQLWVRWWRERQTTS